MVLLRKIHPQKYNLQTAAELNIKILEFVKIIDLVFIFSAVLFFVSMAAYLFLAKKFNSLLSQHDKSLAQEFSFNFSVVKNTNFVKFLFGNKFYETNNEKIIKLCKITKIVGWTMQGAFNIFILSFILFILGLIF